MAQSLEHSARVGGHEFLNVEGNMEAQLLGRNMDDSTPLLQHDNVCIRAPARTAYAIKQAIVENLGDPFLAFFAAIREAIVENLVDPFLAFFAASKKAIVENPGILVMSMVLLAGLSLAFVAATSQEFNPMLVIAAAIIFIFSAVVFRVTRT